MKKYDFIVIGIILAAALIVFAALNLGGHGGAYVSVEADGEIVETLPLGEDTEYVINTPYGTNTLVIKDKKASITEADCKNQICVHHGAISKSGECIVCLPHRVVVSIEDKNNDNEIDAQV